MFPQNYDVLRINRRHSKYECSLKHREVLRSNFLNLLQYTEVFKIIEQYTHGIEQYTEC